MGIFADRGIGIVGLRVFRGRLFEVRTKFDPNYQVLVTAEQRDDYLRPRPIDLAGAKATFAMATGGNRGVLGLQDPKRKGMTVVVELADGAVYRGWTKTMPKARKFCRAVNAAALAPSTA